MRLSPWQQYHIRFEQHRQEDAFRESVCTSVCISHLLHRIWALFSLTFCIRVCVSVGGGISLQRSGQRSAKYRKRYSETATHAQQLIKWWQEKNGNAWRRGACVLGGGCYVNRPMHATAVRVQADNLSGPNIIADILRNVLNIIRT